MSSSKCHRITAYHTIYNILSVFKRVFRWSPVQFCTDKGWTKMLNAIVITLLVIRYYIILLRFITLENKKKKIPKSFI
jgi:hypothetical protein